jgi:hypothetical protein
MECGMTTTLFPWFVCTMDSIVLFNLLKDASRT